MIIRSLKLENIRSYRNEKIEFPEGSVLLSGDIGSGKSSILLGIEFALFGIMRSGLTGSALLRYGASSGSVELRFDIEEDEYLIKRTLKRSRSSVSQDSGYIIINSRKHELTPVELKAKILNIIGYPESLITRSKSLIYRFTVYTAQEQMKEILFEDKDIRLDTLRKLFGIDKYKTIRENSVLFIREIKKKTAELDVRMEQVEELEKSMEKNSKDLKDIMLQVKEKNAELKTAKDQIEKQKKTAEQYEEEIKKLEELKKETEIKNMIILTKKNEKEKLEKKISSSSISELRKRLEEFSNIKEIKPEKELEEELDTKQAAYSELIKQRSKSEERIKTLAANIEELEQAIQKKTKDSKQVFLMKDELEELEKKTRKKAEQQDLLEEYREKEKTYNLKLERTKLLISESAELISTINTGDICPKCRQTITEEHKKKVIKVENENINKLEDEKKKTASILEKIRTNIQKIKSNLEKINEYKETYQEKKEKLITLEASAKDLVENQKKLNDAYQEKKQLEEKAGTAQESELQKNISEIKKQLAAIREHNIKFREKKNLAESIQKESEAVESNKKEIAEIDAAIREAGQEKEKLEQQKQNFAGIKEKHQAAKQQLENLKQNEKALEIRMAELNQQRTNLNKNIQETEEKLKKLEELKKKIKKLRDIQQWFDSFFVKLMTTMEKHIMVSIHREFSSLLKEWFSILIQDIDITLDDEFSVTLIQDGYEAEIDSLSGGEKTSAALAYRLALNKVVNDLIPSIKTKGLIILDEPTDGFSSEQLDKVRDVIEQLSMKQTIIVSHEPKMESYVENIIRIAKSGSMSRVVQ